MKYESIKKTIATLCAITTIFSSLSLIGCKKKTESNVISYNIEELTLDKDIYSKDELSFIKFKLDLDNDETTYYHVVKEIINDEIEDINFINTLFNGIIELNDKKFTSANLEYKVYDFIVFDHELYTNANFHGYFTEHKEEKEIKVNMDIYESKESNIKIYTVKSNIIDIKTKEEDYREFSLIYSLDNNELISGRAGIAFTISLTPFGDIVKESENYTFNELYILENELIKISNRDVKTL